MAAWKPEILTYQNSNDIFKRVKSYVTLSKNFDFDFYTHIDNLLTFFKM